LIGQATARATKQEQKRLSLTAAVTVMRITRIRYRQQHPSALESVVLPLSRLPGLARDGEFPPDMSELARQHGLALGLARERVSVVRAGRHVATHLGVREGARLLKLDRVTSTPDGTPIEWRVSLLAPSE